MLTSVLVWTWTFSQTHFTSIFSFQLLLLFKTNNSVNVISALTSNAIFLVFPRGPTPFEVSCDALIGRSIFAETRPSIWPCVTLALKTIEGTLH